MSAVAVIGTDTGVGKTRVAELLVHGLRQLGRRVWIHKPVACGGFDGSTSEDGRALAALCGDGQDPLTVCPRQFREPASPHLAAAAEGQALSLTELLAGIAAVRGPHDLVVEGIGGILVPLTPARETVLDLLVAARLPALVVTRPHLGTLNHTALTVLAARARGLPLVGLVVNAAQPCPPGLASERAASELTALTGLPVLAEIAYEAGRAAVGMDPHARRIASAVRAWQLAADGEAGSR
jgi:dethiobiotin synthetase